MPYRKDTALELPADPPKERLRDRATRFVKQKVSKFADGYARDDIRGGVGAVFGSGPQGDPNIVRFRNALLGLDHATRAYAALDVGNIVWANTQQPQALIQFLVTDAEELVAASRELLRSYEVEWGRQRRGWEGQANYLATLLMELGRRSPPGDVENGRASQMVARAVEVARELTSNAHAASKAWSNTPDEP